MKRIFAAALSLLVYAYASAQGLDQVDLIINSTDGVYQKGDTVRVWAEAVDGWKDSLMLTVQENEAKVLRKEKVFLPAGRSLIYEGASQVPVHLMFTLADPSDRKKTVSVGAIVSPQDIRPGYAVPAGLREFWDRQIARMREMPPEPVLTRVYPKNGKGYECFDVEIPMPEGNPVKGYVAWPKGAEDASLPIVIYAHQAGVNRSFNRASAAKAVAEAKRGGGALAFDINAHGIPNDAPQEYYDSLAAGPLHFYQHRPVYNHKDFYFRLMYLRLVRALDYLAGLPQWDGERVLVHGSSQGAGQAGALAGIDSRVTAAVLQVPALTDMGGKTDNERKGGWPSGYSKIAEKPLEAAVLPYYDVASLLTLSKAKLFVEAGLIDVTCPPSCVAAGFNNAASGDKVIVFHPYRPHASNRIDDRHMAGYEADVVKQREEFIADFLK